MTVIKRDSFNFTKYPEIRFAWNHFLGGGNAEYVAVHEDHVMAVPAGLTLMDAAAIPEVWLTAYQLLHFVGKTKILCCCFFWGGGVVVRVFIQNKFITS